jgi:hypothetical protein
MHTDGNTNYGVAPSPNTEAYPDDVLAARRADAELTHTITIRTCDLLVMSKSEPGLRPSDASPPSPLVAIDAASTSHPSRLMRL